MQNTKGLHVLVGILVVINIVAIGALVWLFMHPSEPAVLVEEEIVQDSIRGTATPTPAAEQKPLKVETAEASQEDTSVAWKEHQLPSMGIKLMMPGNWAKTETQKYDVNYSHPFFKFTDAQLSQLFVASPQATKITLDTRAIGGTDLNSEDILAAAYLYANLESGEPIPAALRDGVVKKYNGVGVYRDISSITVQSMSGDFYYCTYDSPANCEAYFKGEPIDNYRSAVILSTDFGEGFKRYHFIISHKDMETLERIVESIEVL